LDADRGSILDAVWINMSIAKNGSDTIWIFVKNIHIRMQIQKVFCFLLKN